MEQSNATWHVGNVRSQAPRPARLPDWPLAFNTRTSTGHRDALALGFDGAYVAGVWIGRADGTPVPGMYRVEVAAPVLFEVFAGLGGTVAQPPAPPGVLEVASNAALLEHLRQLGARTAVIEDAPPLTF